jgi:hypothetical protein
MNVGTVASFERAVRSVMEDVVIRETMDMIAKAGRENMFTGER